LILDTSTDLSDIGFMNRIGGEMNGAPYLEGNNASDPEHRRKPKENLLGIINKLPGMKVVFAALAILSASGRGDAQRIEDFDLIKAGEAVVRSLESKGRRRLHKTLD